MRKEVIKLTGRKDGPTSVIIAGVHGDEVCGVLAFEELLPTLTIEAGTVFFLIGNPNAVAENVRFTEFNLNRAFKKDNQITSLQKESYEYRRAQFLRTYLDEASALLDIHSSFTPGSIPFVICEKNALDIVRHFPVELVVSGFDRVNPGGTDYYMNRACKVGICIECGEHLAEGALNLAKQAILSFLWSMGHISEKYSSRLEQKRISVELLYHSKTPNLVLAKNWDDFERVPVDALIGTDGDEQLTVEGDDNIIVFARNCDKAGEEAFYLGRELPLSRGFCEGDHG